MKKIFAILFFVGLFANVNAQSFNVLDTTISGVKYKVFVNAINYSLRGDSVMTCTGEITYKLNKAWFSQPFKALVTGKSIDVVVGVNTCRFAYSQSKLKAILRQKALVAIGE